MRQQLIICGREFGTYDGWDQVDTMTFAFLRFDSEGVFPLSDLFVDFQTGAVHLNPHDETPIVDLDIVDFLAKGKKIEPLDEVILTEESKRGK